MLDFSAPFISAYWPYLMVTALLAIILAYFLSSQKKEEKTRNERKSGKTVSFEKGDHPLAEFEEKEQLDPSLAPPLHSEDTPQRPFKIERYSEEEMKKRSKAFYEQMNQRRSVRQFSKEHVPLEVIENVIKTAGTSPSGAHSEPWTFVVVQDPKLKTQIREIVEQEEYINYDRRMSDQWVNDLKFVKTTHEKPYLEEAPYIILVMKQQYHIGENGVRYAHYYYEISTAISAGFLLTAIHNAGLVSVTTTPMNAGASLRDLLGRPENEKVMLLLPVGYPAEDAEVPDIGRKSLDKIMVLK